MEVEEGDFGSGLRRRAAEEKGGREKRVRKRKKRETPWEGESMAERRERKNDEMSNGEKTGKILGRGKGVGVGEGGKGEWGQRGK